MKTKTLRKPLKHFIVKDEWDGYKYYYKILTGTGARLLHKNTYGREILSVREISEELYTWCQQPRKDIAEIERELEKETKAKAKTLREPLKYFIITDTRNLYSYFYKILTGIDPNLFYKNIYKGEGLCVREISKEEYTKGKLKWKI